MTPAQQQQFQQVQALVYGDPQIRALASRPAERMRNDVDIRNYIRTQRPDIQQQIDALPSQGLGGSTWGVTGTGRVFEDSGVTWGSILRPAAIVGGGIGLNALAGPGAVVSPGAAAGPPTALAPPVAGGALPASQIPATAGGALSTGAGYAPAGVNGMASGGGIGGFLTGNTAGIPNWLPLASLGGNLAGGYFAARAANNAAEQQAQSAREALALAREMYGQTRADLGPYREAGGQGLTALTALLGLPGGAATGAPAGMTPGAPVPPGALAHSMPPGAAPTGYAVPRGTAPGGVPGGMVTLRAPTGQMRAVPADQAAFYLARGASQV